MSKMIPPAVLKRDPNTLSNYDLWRTSHTAVNLDVQFEKKRVSGHVKLTIISGTTSDSTEIILDTSYLDISEIKVNDSVSKWDLLPRQEPYGSALKIHLDKGVPFAEQLEVSISVSTTKGCTAIQWLTPAQTSTKKHPYMFSQCQAIHARSIFPCQDTPDVKSTFSFNITSPLPVIASGVPSSSNPTSTSDSDSPQTYKFTQSVPIPSYLFALASGDLAIASIGPRSAVVTSPDQIVKCTNELSADTESFLKAAEKIVFPYAWGQYNVLVLPPSFPYGGMENPIFTFATPTIISGDRANVDVIAHELAHSWSGNLVSNASWEHFWLNEGWTTYLERRIQAAIHGDEAWRDFSAIIGWKALLDSVEDFGEDHEYTKLIVNLKGADPDDAFSSVPYEKGFTFLLYLEKMLGREKFDAFIPYYFDQWRGRSLDSFEFRTTLRNFFGDDPVASAILRDLDWDTWFYKPGLPPKPEFNTALVIPAYELADKWATLAPSDQGHISTTTFEPSASDITSLTSNQLVVFLERILLFATPFSASAAAHMGTVYAFRTSQNVELSSRWCQVAMRSGDRTCLDTVTGLLGSVGRMKFVSPLYKGLLKIDRPLAEKAFERNREFYHPICRGMVEKLFADKKERS